eukprot:c9943_g1_i1.p1 GENE.c9943_g1_i1~~c9943_g1_i1.p1  ORF type:complete len:482 (-),score=123.92 c9943_g1_i1:165-1526(-)
MSTSLTLVFDNEYQSVPCTTELSSFITTVGIRAPKFETTDTATRAGMDIVAVLDRSGSMAGEKMKMLHETVRLMIDNLKDIDRLSLVSYDDRDEVNLPLTRMDKPGKDAARLALAQINDRGSTNLSGGLWRGLQVLKDRTDGKNEVSSVLLLTDGLANAGVVEPTALVSQTQALLQSMNNPTSIYCFGFGADHDSNLLSSLAQAAHGTYYFMKTTDSIPLAFADCLGGLMSVIAQNIVLTITAADGVNINSIATIFPKTEVIPQKQYSLAIGDLFSEEERDILVDITVPRVSGEVFGQPLLASHVKYMNVIEERSYQQDIVTVIDRTSAESGLGSASSKVDQERNRIRTAVAMEEAQRLGNQGQLEQARQVLAQCQQTIAQSTSAPASAMLLQDLEAVSSRMQSQHEFRAEGGHRLKNKAAKYYMQRACESDDLEVQAFATSAKSMFRSAFKK